jgi:hypothetical protein
MQLSILGSVEHSIANLIQSCMTRRGVQQVLNMGNFIRGLRPNRQH